MSGYASRPRQHHLIAAAVKMPRAQPGRECLAVHARQLALEQNLQVLRRHPRPLLLRLEPTRRSALAHHVHRSAIMGTWVILNGIWYEADLLATFCDSTPPDPPTASLGRFLGPRDFGVIAGVTHRSVSLHTAV